MNLKDYLLTSETTIRATNTPDDSEDKEDTEESQEEIQEE